MDPVLIIGAGNYATATAIRLQRCGIKSAICSQMNGADLRYHLNFSAVLKTGYKEIDAVTAESPGHFMENSESAEPEIDVIVEKIFSNRRLPVIDCTELNKKLTQRFTYVLAFDKSVYQEVTPLLDKNDHVLIGLRSLKIDASCRYVVEDQSTLFGQVRYPFIEQKEEAYMPDNETVEVKSIHAGLFLALKKAGDKVAAKEMIGEINGDPVVAPSPGGYIKGILPSGILVERSQTISLLDEKGPVFPSLGPPDFAIAGGFVEAIFFDKQFKKSLNFI